MIPSPCLLLSPRALYFSPSFFYGGGGRLLETLPIDAVKPGAVLAVPVTDARGNVLVGEGRVLTEEWLARLRIRGVLRLSVESQAAQGAPEAGAAGAPVQDPRLERLDAMFARHAGDELMIALAAAARQVLSEGTAPS
jgi:hypothetical protein